LATAADQKDFATCPSQTSSHACRSPSSSAIHAPTTPVYTSSKCPPPVSASQMSASTYATIPPCVSPQPFAHAQTPCASSSPSTFPSIFPQTTNTEAYTHLCNVPDRQSAAPLIFFVVRTFSRTSNNTMKRSFEGSALPDLIRSALTTASSFSFVPFPLRLASPPYRERTASELGHGLLEAAMNRL
jgi:hypothetical protein